MCALPLALTLTLLYPTYTPFYSFYVCPDFISLNMCRFNAEFNALSTHTLVCQTFMQQAYTNGLAPSSRPSKLNLLALLKVSMPPQTHT